jgi:FkbM family methyltransferase
MARVNISVHKVSFNVYSPDTRIENTWDDISKGLWEPQTLRIISSFIDETDCALELGIDLGQTTMFTAHFAGKLIAVEPSLDSINLAKKHLELNKHLQDKTILVHGALSNSRGKVFFGKGSKLFDDIHFGVKNPNIEVEGYLIQDFEKFAGRPITFINMDIEGGEYVCLSAMRSYLWRKKPTLLLSLHPGFLLTDKWRKMPVMVRYLKRFIEQTKVFTAVMLYPYIYNAVDLKRIYAFSVFSPKYIRSKSAHNSQILCMNKSISKLERLLRYK